MASRMILDHALQTTEKTKCKYTSTSVRLRILVVCIAFAGIQDCDTVVVSPPALATRVSTLQPPEFGTSFASIRPTIVKTRASSNAGTPTLITAAAAAAPPTPGLFYCDAPQLTVLPSVSGGPSVDVTLEGDDMSQTFTAGSDFRVHIDSQLTGPDRLTWQTMNFAGAAIATGTIALGAGNNFVIVPCKAHVSGSFTVSVNFQKADLILPQKGSRPSSFASFGILPDFSNLFLRAASAEQSFSANRFEAPSLNYS